MTGGVLVVGGGIAGRAVARVLARGGIECTVAERRGGCFGLGMGVNLPGNAVRALHDLGVAAPALARGVDVRRREYRNSRGRLLFHVDDADFWSAVGRPVCIRHGYLLEALGLPSGVRFEHARVTAGRPSSTGVEVDLENTRLPHRFDFVVGADGVHSTIRKAVTRNGVHPSTMTGSSWRFVGPDPGVGCWTAWSGPDLTALLIPVESGRVYGYVARTRGGEVGAEPGWLTTAAAGFPALVRTAIERAISDGELFRAPVEEVLIDRWHGDRLALIGDAAHATAPVWAQGVAMALEDALVLGGLLVNNPPESWPAVGAEFERVRRPRVTHVQIATERMSTVAGMPGWARDVSARVIGPASYRSAYRPLRTPISLPQKGID